MFGFPKREGRRLLTLCLFVSWELLHTNAETLAQAPVRGLIFALHRSLAKAFCPLSNLLSAVEYAKEFCTWGFRLGTRKVLIAILQAWIRTGRPLAASQLPCSSQTLLRRISWSSRPSFFFPQDYLLDTLFFQLTAVRWLGQ